MLTHFDDCAGIGGFALAARMAGGITTIAAREIDPYCRRVYARHFPHVRLYDDCRGPVPNESPDLYTCGFPCQPVSVAGKRLGDKDPRWLWPDIARTIRVLRPRWVLLENVPGLLGRGMGQVLGDLAACGYDAEWDCIPAAAVGAPHRRDRLWIVAHASELYLYGGNDKRSSGQSQISQSGNGDCSADVADAASAGSPHWTIRAQRAPTFAGEPQRSDWWATEPGFCRVAHGVPARVDRLRGLGNAIVPHVAAWIMRRIVEADE